MVIRGGSLVSDSFQMGEKFCKKAYYLKKKTQSKSTQDYIQDDFVLPSTDSKICPGLDLQPTLLLRFSISCLKYGILPDIRQKVLQSHPWD